MRSWLFNLLFYGLTAVFCMVFLPALLLPRRVMVALIIKGYMPAVHWIERHVLGLDYRVIGAENLPTSGAYLVAMKHQSAYETLKLHLLFGDAAIILKKELLWLPLWGWFAAKMRVIAVDRGKGGKSMASLLAGGERAKADGRPIVIFPQGTRVPVGVEVDEKPYKIGIYKLYSHLQLPVIPVALNSGLYWGRNAVTKRGGVVTFHILPAIPPDLPANAFMTRLTHDIETASAKLLTE